MSNTRAEEEGLSEENSVYIQSNDDADSDDSSWNDGSEPKRKSSASNSRPQPRKVHKSRRKKSSKKKRHNKKRNVEENLSDTEVIEKVAPSKGVSSRQKAVHKSEVKLSDNISDDLNSIMSDINPPSLATRLRRRKQHVRQTWKGASSASSAIDSDGKKPRSEPILITLDSDSDDNISMLSSQPSRIARVKGEIMRKYKQMSGIKKKTTKYTGSSSSSDSEKVKRAKKNKKKSKISTSTENIDLPTGTQESGIKPFKKSKKTHKALLYSPSHKRHLKIQKIRKRFEKQNFERRIIPVRQSRIVSRQPSRSSVSRTSSTKRVLRNNSHLHINYEEEVNVLRFERRTRRSLSDQKSNNDEMTENINKKKVSKILPSSNAEPLNDEDVKPNDSTSERNCLEETIKLENKERNSIEQDLKAISENIQAEDKSIVKEEKNISKPDGVAEVAEVKKEIEEKSEINDETLVEIKSSSLKISTELVLSLRKKKKIKKHVIPPRPSNMIRRVGRGRPRKFANEDSPSKPETLSILNIKPQTPFLQSSFCFDVAPKLAKCRECRIAIYRSVKRMYNSYCRFMEYRKLGFNKNGQICLAGFSNPNEATQEHIQLWMPQPHNPPQDLNLETAKSLVEHIGDQFCDLIEQEKEAINLHIGLNQIITWKRVVKGVREMCDVCSTTIFNIHWVCPNCGLTVCIDCYKVRKLGEIVPYDDEQPKDRDEFRWLLCSLRNPHRQDTLVMAQIIPGTSLWLMRDWLHKTRDMWNIPSFCKCNPPQVSPSNLISNGINKQLMSHVTKTFLSDKYQSFVPEKNIHRYENSYDDLDVEVADSALRWLDNSSTASENISTNIGTSDEYFNSLEDILLLRGKNLLEDSNDPGESESDKEFSNFSLDDIIASVKSLHKKSKNGSERSVVKYFNQRYPKPISGRDPLPIRIYTKIESDIAFPTVPHSWFCNGRLLFLHQADHKDNLLLFQELWKRGQPVLVKSVDENLDMNLWHPDSFCQDFGEEKNDLVDCKTGNILKNLPMKKFWEGFENLEKRMTDDNGEFLLLKLKDWPPGEDFSEMLPTRFQDLMKGLPLPEYTHRDGILNLAGRLPATFVRPDLGPKMYNAYGSALFPTKGTTNLHLDVSDAVNVMVYVGIPSDGNAQIHIEEALKAIDEGGCDSLMRARVRGRGCKPGALWHIYNARDADKIRNMLTKVAIERGEKLEANHDPIHDQSWYIDEELRLRLYRDYGVEGYAIAQCLGDAVFIPAGAPHQVRNLHSCVKVAEDFVSPENIAHCFKLTQEFRHLSDTHTNHEDKLQIKNIIYHVVKDALSHLISSSDIPC